MSVHKSVSTAILYTRESSELVNPLFLHWRSFTQVHHAHRLWPSSGKTIITNTNMDAYNLFCCDIGEWYICVLDICSYHQHIKQKNTLCNIVSIKLRTQTVGMCMMFANFDKMSTF